VFLEKNTPHSNTANIFRCDLHGFQRLTTVVDSRKRKYLFLGTAEHGALHASWDVPREVHLFKLLLPGKGPQIRRMRDPLAQLIKEEGLDFDAGDLIPPEETSTRVVRYRITIDVVWEHWPRPGDPDSLTNPRMPKIPPALLGSNNCIRPEHWL